MIKDARLLPYIQLHEFETLLFSSVEGFESVLDNKYSEQLKHVVLKFHNPEDINNTPIGAPSKRILSAYPGYEKVLEGEQIASNIGVEVILKRCPRFAKWIETIISRCS